jgi:hypothetical protein
MDMAQAAQLWSETIPLLEDSLVNTSLAITVYQVRASQWQTGMYGRRWAAFRCTRQQWEANTLKNHIERPH